RAERDGLTGQAIGVALAVPAFVMAPDERDHLREVYQGGEDLRPDDHVLLHVLVLRVGKRSLLPEHLLPDADLADVVEPAAGPYQLDLFVGATHLRGHHGG